jgi:hypothetical protein
MVCARELMPVTDTVMFVSSALNILFGGIFFCRSFSNFGRKAVRQKAPGARTRSSSVSLDTPLLCRSALRSSQLARRAEASHRPIDYRVFVLHSVTLSHRGAGGAPANARRFAFAYRRHRPPASQSRQILAKSHPALRHELEKFNSVPSFEDSKLVRGDDGPSTPPSSSAPAEGIR